MPTYRYVAMSARGVEERGALDASDQSEAIARIKEMHLFPTNVRETKATADSADHKSRIPGFKLSKFFGGGLRNKGGRKLGLQMNVAIPGFRSRVPTKALGVFTAELATLLQAGLPLLRG